MAKVLNAFSTPIWKWDEETLPEGTEEWVDEYIETIPNTTQKKSSRGGYQSYSLGPDDLKDNGYIHNKVKELIPLPSRLNNWWINCNGKGDYNASHVHAGCDLSLVWAITEAKGLCLTHPTAYSRSLLPIPTKHEFNLKKGDIILFPSDVPHYVNSNEDDERRITIAINFSLLPIETIMPQEKL